MKQSDIPLELIRRRFNYNPKTGSMIWNIADQRDFKRAGGHKTFNKKHAGKEVGSVRKVSESGLHYRFVHFLGFTMRVHRVAWFHCYGSWPTDGIDHINGDGLDNRIANLRDVSQLENLKNLKLRSSSLSGFPGIYYIKDTNKWHAKITRINLGFFNTKEEAVAARKAAEICLNYHENHGRY